MGKNLSYASFFLFFFSYLFSIEKGVYIDGKKEGLFKTFTEKGQIVSQAFYQKGLLHGKKECFYANSLISSIEYYFEGKLHGEANYWYSTGQKHKNIHYFHGKKSGHFYQWNRLGKLIKEGVMLQNQPQGIWHFFSPFENRLITSDFSKKKPAVFYQFNDQSIREYTYENGLLEGPYFSYSKDLFLIEKGEYQNNQKSGEWVFYIYSKDSPNEDPSLKKIQRVCHYQNNLLNGECLIYHPNNTLFYSMHYKDNLLEGPFLVYDDQGVLREQILYQRGLKQGLFTIYFANGKKSIEGSYNRDLLDGVCLFYSENGKSFLKRRFLMGSGVFPKFYTTGEILSETTFKTGTKHGSETVYYPSGQVKQRLFYSFDLLDGRVCEYGEKGQLLAQSYWKKGVRSGSFKQWYGTGQKKIDLIYENNLPKGHVKQWYENGQLRLRGQWHSGIGSYQLYDRYGSLMKESKNSYKLGH